MWFILSPVKTWKWWMWILAMCCERSHVALVKVWTTSQSRNPAG
jgi:hypothetical protein